MNQNGISRTELLTVLPADVGIRLDVFCASRLRAVSRSRIQKLINDGHVLVDSRRRPASYPLTMGEAVKIEIPPPVLSDERPVPQDIPLRIVFEDDDLVVINKEAGIVVHPAVGNRDRTVVNALLGRGVPLSNLGGRDRPGVVHRLDKDTSGLLVVAKTDRAYQGLTEQIGARDVQKTYHAIVWGHLGVRSLRIDAPIARHPVHRQRMAVAKRGGRGALTEAFVVDTFEHFDYIRVITFTGRTHQIRVHLSHISHPILGDPVYGGRRMKGASSDAKIRAITGVLLDLVQRQALHASRMVFRHPVTGQRLELKTALPDDMRSAIEVLYREEKHLRR